MEKTFGEESFPYVKKGCKVSVHYEVLTTCGNCESGIRSALGIVCGIGGAVPPSPTDEEAFRAWHADRRVSLYGTCPHHSPRVSYTIVE